MTGIEVPDNMWSILMMTAVSHANFIVNSSSVDFSSQEIGEVFRRVPRPPVVTHVLAVGI